MKQRDSGRSCGPCTACCKPFAIPEVGKDVASWCQYCTVGTGCGIYSKRPQACKSFACMWLNGKGDASDRPDLLGVMMDIADAHLPNRIFGVLHLWEIEEGALDQPRIRQVAEALKNQGLVVFYHELRGRTYKNQLQIPLEFFSEEEIEQIAAMEL